MTYSVAVEYFSRGRIDPGFAAAESRAQQFTRAADRYGSQFGSNFASGVGGTIAGVTDTLVSTISTAAMIAASAAGAAIGYGIKQGISANADFEGSINSIASTLHMLNDTPIDQGVRQASESTERLRQLAAKLPGTFADARNAFASIVPVGVEHGVSMKRLENLAAQSVAVGASLGVDMRTTGHETAAILEGRAKSSMPLFARLGLGSASSFNKLSAEKRFAKVEDRFGKMGGSMSLFENSWHGMTSTMQDNLTNVARNFSEPLFGSMKESLRRALDYYSANEGRILSSAHAYGQHLRHAWEVGTRAALKWGPILYNAGKRFGDAIAHGFERVRPYLDRAGQLAERFATDEHAPAKVGGAALALGGARLGIGAANMLGPALGLELGPALLAIAPLAIAAAGAMHAYTDEQSYFHDSVVRGVDDIRSRIGPTFDHLTAAAKRLEGPAVLLADRMGSVLVTSLEASALAIEKGTWLFDKWTSALERTYEAIKPWLDKLIPPSLNRDPDQVPVTRDPIELFPIKAINSLANENREGVPKPPTHVTHVHPGAFRIEVTGTTDPQRLARDVSTIVMRKLATPTGLESNLSTPFNSR